MIKILIGGSPCTYWSIAKGKNREIEASGVGWELFKNFLIAKEKFNPDYFLYENNKSASILIKEQIQLELKQKLMYINSALVSAQNRERFYVFNWESEQPEDREIILSDIVETDPDEITYNLLSKKEIEYMFRKTKDGRNHFDYKYFSSTTEEKSSCITSNLSRGVPYNVITQPVRIGTIKNSSKNPLHDSKQYRVYSQFGKSTTICGEGGGVGAKTGLYATIVLDKNKFPEDKVYNVKDKNIIINGENNRINLPDGNYIIRKLTPVECERLQTLPDNYTAGVSNTQRYKAIGNGWTAEVIIHILNSILKNVDRNEKIVVLSMYDGIGTGRYCFDKMGFNNVEYHSFEIDKYAIEIANKNYPDIIQHGDAFKIREDGYDI